MPTGNVQWFDPKKGFVFIIGENGQDVFVHYTGRQLRDELQKSYSFVMPPRPGMQP